MIDWYDKNQCHHNDVNVHDRTNGRIFKVSYGDAKKGSAGPREAVGSELVGDAVPVQ